MSDAAAPTLSLNEVAALAAKAARGAGLGWGHAEDLGQAARWLAERGFAWDAALCRLLEAEDVAARTGRLAAAADWTAGAQAGQVRDLDDVGDAIWILPLASAAIFGSGRGLRVSGPGTTFRLAPDGTVASRKDPSPSGELAGPVRIEVVTPDAPIRERSLRGRADRFRPVACARLAALAARTLGPASETARAKGAGSVRSDHD